MKRRTCFFILAVFLILSLLPGCDTFLSPKSETKNIEPEEQYLNRDDEIALMHLEAEYIWSEEDLRVKVEESIVSNKEAADKNGLNEYPVLAITGVEFFSKKYEPGFISKDGKPQVSDIGFYLFLMKDQLTGKEGYALCCEDKRIGGIFAFVPEGSFYDEENQFLEMYKAMLETYIKTTISKYNSKTEDDIKNAQLKLSQLESSERWIYYWNADTYSNLTNIAIPLNTTWCGVSNSAGNGIQPYNWAIDNLLNPNSQQNPTPNPNPTWFPGPDVTALSQVVAFCKSAPPVSASIMSAHGNYNQDGWPYGNVLTSKNSFKYPPNATLSFNTIGSYDFNNMTSTNNAMYLPPLLQAQVAALFFDMGCRMDKYFTQSGTNVMPIEFAANALYDMKYRYYDIISGERNEVFYSMMGIKRSIDEGKLVYSSASKYQYDSNDGHSTNYYAWIIYGYRTTISYPYGSTIEVYCNMGDGRPGSFFELGPINSGISKPNETSYPYDAKHITGIQRQIP